MKLLRLFALGAMLLTAPACDSLLGNDDENFSFESVQINYTEGMEDEAEAVGVLRTLRIDGIIILPHPCHELQGELRRFGATYEMTVVADPTNNTGCTAQVQAVQYQGQSFGVPRGVLRVVIYHQIEGQPRRLINQVDVTVG